MSYEFKEADPVPKKVSRRRFLDNAGVAAVAVPFMAATFEAHSLSGKKSSVTASTTSAATRLVVAEGGSSQLPASKIMVVPPSGDRSGAADKANINAVISAGGAVQLLWTPLSAPYYINGPLLPAPSSAILGQGSIYGSDEDYYGIGSGEPGGTIIQVSSSFSGEAAILLSNETSGQQNMGCYFKDFVLDCEPMPAQGDGNNGHGIEITGAWAAGRMDNVFVLKAQGSCLVMQNANSVRGNPDDWIVTNCKFHGAKGSGETGGYGALLEHAPDCVFIGCEASECNRDAWLVGSVTNASFTACKGENSANGWHMTGFYSAGSYATFGNCESNENGYNGWLFDGTVGGLSTYVLSGCRATNDNQADGSYAGFRATGCPSRIIGSGCYAGDSVAYGAYQESKSYFMCFTGSYLSGSVAASYDDGSNTHTLVNQSPVAY